MSPQISIPQDSNFDLERAVELLRLTKKAQDIHKRFKENLDNDWARWYSRDDRESPMPMAVEGHGTYQVLEMLERAEFMWGRRKVVPFGFVAEKDNRLYVVFRGTATIPEWVANIFGFHRAYKTVPGSGNVHRGFNAIYSRPDNGQWWEVQFGGLLNWNKENDRPSMAQKVQKLLTDKDKLAGMDINGDTPCFVTGHSLGGALATLAALHISKSTDFSSPILYTYANPRAGDSTFASTFTELEAYRIFNSEDLVPILPLPTIKLKGPSIERADVEKKYQVLKILPPQSYVHIGESIAFTDPQGTIAKNHVIPSYLKFLAP